MTALRDAINAMVAAEVVIRQYEELEASFPAKVQAEVDLAANQLVLLHEKTLKEREAEVADLKDHNQKLQEQLNWMNQNCQVHATAIIKESHLDGHNA